VKPPPLKILECKGNLYGGEAGVKSGQLILYSLQVGNNAVIAADVHSMVIGGTGTITSVDTYLGFDKVFSITKTEVNISNNVNISGTLTADFINIENLANINACSVNASIGNFSTLPVVNSSTGNFSTLNADQFFTSNMTVSAPDNEATSFVIHNVCADKTNYALFQNADGQTNINSSNHLYFRTRGELQMKLDSAGQLGIGTLTPDALLHVSGTAIIDTSLQSPLLNTSYLNASELFVRFGSEFQGSMLIRNDLEVDNKITADNIRCIELLSGVNVCMTGQVISSLLKANNRVDAPTVNASTGNVSILNVSQINISSITLNTFNVSQVNASSIDGDLIVADEMVATQLEAVTGAIDELTTIDLFTDVLYVSQVNASNLSCINVSATNGAFTVLRKLDPNLGLEIFSYQITTDELYVTDAVTENMLATDKIIIQTALPTLYLRDTDHIAGAIQQNNDLMAFRATSNVGGPLVLTRTMFQINCSTDDALFYGNVSVTEKLQSAGLVSTNASLTNLSGVNASFTYLTADNLQETLIAGPGIAIVDRTISTQQILVAGNNIQIIDETISTTSLLNISNVSSEKGKIVNLSCTNLSATSITASNVQPTLTTGSNLTLVGTLINTSSNLNISNVSVVNGFIYTFEADTIETIGLNSQGVFADEADITTVRAIGVDTNTLTCLTGGITNLSSTNISGARGTITNFSSTNSSATRGTITNISCSNISCSLKINVLNVSGTNATFTSLTANNVQPTLTAGTGITIVGTTISSTATLVAGSNISILNGVIKTTSNVNLSNLSTDVLHSPVIVSNLITSIDGEIDILNADISVTTPFLAATNISSTNGTFHNLSVANEIQASIVNASTIIAEDAFSVLSSTLSTSFYTDFVDDQKFVLKVTGVGSPSAPKLAFRTGTADALLITQSSNVSIGNHLTVTNTSGTNASFTNLTADNVQPLLTAGSGVSIVNNVISAGASAITAGLNISILNDVVSTTSNFSVSTLYVTGDSTVGPVLNIGLNDNSTTPKTIYFGGLNGDNAYNHTVIESRIYSGSENAELLLFKGNDVNADRIRLRAAIILFDTYTGATTDRTAENIRMMINSAGRVGIGTTNPTRPLQVVGDIYCTGNISCEGYMKANDKPRMRIVRDNFTLPSGTTSLLNGGSVSLRENCTVSSGIFIATIAGIYACSCKLRLPDNNNQAPEIQWYRRAGSGQQSSYENFEMWIPNGVAGRRAGMSHTIIDLNVGDGILPRNDLQTMGGCFATFDVFMIQ